MDDDAETATSVVDSALFADLFKSARRGGLTTEPGVIGNVGKPADPDVTADAGDERSGTVRPGDIIAAHGTLDWPSEDLDDSLGRASGTSVRPQGVSAIGDEPARTGWRSLVGLLTAGLVKPRPGKAERRSRAALAVMRSSLDHPLTVVFVHADPAARECGITLRAANAFGAARGGSVLAWSVGTPGMAGAPPAQEPPVAPSSALVADLDRLRGDTPRLTDLARFTQPQRTGVDVLPGDAATPPDPRWFAAAHAVLSRFYTILCVEVGDDLPAHAWAAVADVLVLCGTATTASVDAAMESVAALRADGHGALADGAIGVVHAKDKAPSVVLKMLGDRMRAELASVLTVGYRRERKAVALVNSPARIDPVWTFLGASIIDSSVTRDPTSDRPVKSKVDQS